MSESGATRLGRWQAWQMDELAESTGPAPDRVHAQATPDPAPRQQAELQALRAQVQEAAQRDGYAAGLAQGRDKGYQQGLEQGRREGERELAEARQQLSARLTALIGSLAAALEQLDTDVGDALADLALAGAKQLADAALDARPEQVRTLIRKLLREAPLFSGHPLLRLHPDDLALVDKQLCKELDAAGWKAQPDPTLERGGCRVTGPEGELNATREVRWQALVARARRHGSAPIRSAKPRKPESAAA